MPRLHMQVLQPDTERKACIKVFCIVKVTRYIVYKEVEILLKIADMKSAF